MGLSPENVALPDEIAMLKEYRAGERRVLDEAETPAEDVRNALQVLEGARDRKEYLVGRRNTATLLPDEIQAIERRLSSAIEKLEATAPRSVELNIAEAIEGTDIRPGMTVRHRDTGSRGTVINAGQYNALVEWESSLDREQVYLSSLIAEAIEADLTPAQLQRELDAHPNSFILRVHSMERRLVALERRAGERS